MAGTLGSALRDELARLFEPLSAVESPGGVADLLRAVGRSGPIESDQDLTAELRRIAQLLADLTAIDGSALDSWDDLERILGLGEDLVAGLGGLDTITSNPDLRDDVADLGTDLVEWMTAQYLRRYHPALYWLGALFTLVTPAEETAPSTLVHDGAVVTRLPTSGTRFHGDRLAPLVRDVNGALGAHYAPGGLATSAEAHAFAELLYPRLRAFVAQLGLASVVDVQDLETLPQPSSETDVDLGELGGFARENEGTVEPPQLPVVDTSAQLRTRFPRFAVHLPPASGTTAGGASAPVGLSAVASSAEHPDAIRGLLLGPWIDGSVTEVRGGWQLEVTGDGQIPAFVLGPDGVALAPGLPAGSRGRARVVVERIPDPGEPAFRFGSADGSRVEVGAVRVSVEVDLTPEGAQVAIAIDATSAAAVITADDDGVLGHLLPAGGIRAQFDVGVVLSSPGGLRLRGSTGLTVSIPVGATIGPVRLSAVDLAIRPEGEGVALEAGASVTLRIGPVTIVAEGVGFGIHAAFPDTGGNVGIAELTPGLKPPTGFGLTIDAGPVKGGGLLRRSEDGHTYGGALELLVGRLEVKAFGLLTARADGYSLIIVMSAEFPEPITLPFGWRLVGVGGLVGIHHRLDVSALQAGLRSGVAGQLLFPQDPITAAPQILAGLAAVFPPATGQFVIGPLLKLFWGARGLATLTVAVILELPDPVRVLILGRLEVTAPHRDLDILVLRVDFAGVADFQRPSFELDASIIDSHLGPFTLTGDVAVRLRGGEESLFLLTAGGFHPRFPVPTNANLPALRRIAVALSSGNNPRARLELYTAITSSTWQIGGKLEVSASKAGLTAEARLSVDAIFGEITVDGRTRTGFLAEIEGRAAIKRGGSSIAGVGLTITLTGTEPWHVAGKARINFFFFSVSIPFEGTFGNEPDRADLPLIDAAALLRAALEDRANWETGLPAGVRPLVTIGTSPLDADEILAHPLGRVGVRQHAIPLGVDVVRVGGSRTTPERYEVKTVTVGAETPPVNDLRSPFAAGQYVDLSEDERFTRPAFEPMISGFELTSQSVRMGPAIAADLTYEEFTIGPDGRVEEPKPDRPAISDVFLHAATLGAAATTTLRRDERAGETSPDDTIRIHDVAPVVVDPATLRTVAVPGLGSVATYTEVAQAVARHRADAETPREDLVIVGFHEAVG